MIEVKNISAETLEIVVAIDKTVPGCRVALSPANGLHIEPGQCIGLLGYEPGVSYTFRPVIDLHIPREGLDPHKPYAEKAVADFESAFDEQTI